MVFDKTIDLEKGFQKMLDRIDVVASRIEKEKESNEKNSKGATKMVNEKCNQKGK